MTTLITPFEIPLSPQPQMFDITLGNVGYQFTFTYRDAPDGGWILDIADAGGNPIACGLPLVTGHDLLGQLAYLGINGALVVDSDGQPDQVPTFDNLGITSHLYFLQVRHLG